MDDSGSAGEAFLAELTQTLTASGWTCADRNHFAIMTPEFTHPGTRAVLTITITGTAWATPSAYLLYDEADSCWRVACDNPHPTVLAAAANATLTCGSTSHDGGLPLERLLQEAGWASEQESDSTGQTCGSRWTSLDGTKSVFFHSSSFSAPAWLTHQAVTTTGIRLAQYAPTPATPTAVLAALALTETPASSDGAPSGTPDGTA